MNKNRPLPPPPPTPLKEKSSRTFPREYHGIYGSSTCIHNISVQANPVEQHLLGILVLVLAMRL